MPATTIANRILGRTRIDQFGRPRPALATDSIPRRRLGRDDNLKNWDGDDPAIAALLKLVASMSEEEIDQAENTDIEDIDDSTDPAVAALLKLFASMTPEQLERAKKLAKSQGSSTEPDDSVSLGEDDPAPFKGMPLPGGGMTTAEAERRQIDTAQDAAYIRRTAVQGANHAAARRSPKLGQDSATTSNFARRFPNAARILTGY